MPGSIDGNNVGPLALLALGDYKGEELWHYDPDQGQVQATATRAMRGWPRHRPGEVLMGQCRDVKRKFCFSLDVVLIRPCHPTQFVSPLCIFVGELGRL